MPESKRPIKARVLQRIFDSKEARQIARRAWRQSDPVAVDSLLGAPQANIIGDELNRAKAAGERREAPVGVIPQPEIAAGLADNPAVSDFPAQHHRDGFLVWKALADDIFWQTFVLELVAEEEAWSDSWKTAKENATEGIKSFVEKLFKKEHPAARTVSISIVSLLSLLATHGVIRSVLDVSQLKKLQTDLSIPLVVQVPTEMPSIDVNYGDPRSIKFQPISINPSLPPLSLANPTVDLRDSTGLFSEIQSQNQETVKALQNISRKLADDSGAKASGPVPTNATTRAGTSTILAGINSGTQQLAKFNQALNQKLDNLAGSVAILQGQLEESRKQTTALQAQETITGEASRLGSFSSHLTLSGNDTQSIVLPVSQAGSISLLPLQVQVTSVSGRGGNGTAQVRITSEGTALIDARLNVGATRELTSANGATVGSIVVNAIDRRLGLIHSVRLTIVPN